MKGEINKDYYCSGFWDEHHYSNCTLFGECLGRRCNNLHRKWPTPEQFKEEYGEEYPDDGAVFVEYNGWTLTSYLTAKEDGFELIVCACTPWGKPPAGWRPE